MSSLPVDSTPKISLSEDELVSRLFKKDKLAFSYLYDNYASALYGVIFRIVQDEESAADVMQETFVKIWSNFSQYDKTKGKLFTWLVNVARNLAIDTTRSKSFKNQNKNLELDKVVGYIDSHKSTSFNPDQIGLKTLLEKLRPEQRDIIDLAYFKGYTQVEIAEALNIPLGTVKTRMRMAIMQLRQII
ncbi:MAG TPA: sigma-70 family RNA polymerase sigma factor [Chitinophagales bacterium]|nr:sigma-70 family RNA polymerase sigma factor [Chitinophagales bacterium]